MARNYDTRKFKKTSCAKRPVPDPACQLRQSTNETSLRTVEPILEGNKATQAQPCLCRDGNVFQITDGCMEILVVRLDFSLPDCRGAGPTRRFSKSPL